MKKFLLIPLIMASLTLPAIGTEISKDSNIESVATPKLIDQVSEKYSEGAYRSFLRNIHRLYEDSNKKWEFNDALAERKKLSTLVLDFESPGNEALKKKLSALEEKKNRELIDICLTEPNTSFSRDVKDMVFFTPSKEEQASLDFLADLSTKFKGDGQSPLENQLISIDTEFWLKMLALDIQLTQKKIDATTYKEQRLVLEVEKLSQMKTACTEDPSDSTISAMIETACAIYPKVQAAGLTRKHLRDLGAGKLEPQNVLEQKMKDIIIKYNEKEDALIKGQK